MLHLLHCEQLWHSLRTHTAGMLCPSLPLSCPPLRADRHARTHTRARAHTHTHTHAHTESERACQSFVPCLCPPPTYIDKNTFPLRQPLQRRTPVRRKHEHISTRRRERQRRCGNDRGGRRRVGSRVTLHHHARAKNYRCHDTRGCCGCCCVDHDRNHRTGGHR